MAIRVQQMSGESQLIEAAAGTSVGEFKRLVLEALCGDEVRRISSVELALEEKVLQEDALTLEAAGVAPGAAVMAVLRKRFTSCSSKEEAAIDLTVSAEPAVVAVPVGTTDIGKHAFEGCASIIAVQLPESVTKIHGYAFHRCGALESVEVPGAVVEIGYAAFADCGALRSLTLPGSLKSIGTDAFYGCKALQSLEVPSSVSKLKKGAFKGCKALKSLTLPSHLSVDLFPDRPSECEVTIRPSTPLAKPT